MKIIICISLLFFALTKGQLLAQNAKPYINISFIEEKKSYRISIYNKQDSVLYFFTSRLLSPEAYRVDTTIFLSPALSDNKNRHHYCPVVTSKNLEFSQEALAFKAIAILPYQTKSFDFDVLEGTKEKVFFLEYFYLDSIDYAAFKKEIINTRWFLRYSWKKIEVVF